MESMGSVCGYQEGVDELKNMLLYTTIELEAVRNEAREEMRRNEENVKQLLHLLKVACQERDEARDQLHRLLNKIMPSSPAEICPVLPGLQPETPPVYPMKVNSSNTESDSLSETYNHHSYGSSHVDSFLGVVSSPELSNMNMAESNNLAMPPSVFVQEYNMANSTGIISSGLPESDRASVVINNLIKGKVLPEKGKLLQSVMEAGPLLQTLLVSGPLPQWRNPPPLQPLQMPHFPVKGSDHEKMNKKLLPNVNYPVENSLSSSYPELSYGSSQMYPSTTHLNRRNVISTGVSGDFIHNSITTEKRQRCQ